MPFWAVAAPIIAQAAGEVLKGINTRAARLYDSPKEQVKRFQEAGLPMASTSRITTGGGFVTPTNIQDPSPSIQANLGASLKREIDKKQIDMMRETIKSAAAKASIDTGEAKNILNPAGVFENTNQGTTQMQTIKQQAEVIRGQEIANNFAPAEKALQLQKGNAELNNLIKDLSIKDENLGILKSENIIKSVLAQYQERMSAGELTNLIRRNIGLSLENQGKRLHNVGYNLDNKIKEIAFNVEYATQFAKITEARNRALISGEQLKAMQLNNTLNGMQTESARQWYKIKSRVDQRFERQSEKWYYTLTGQDLMYLGMFNPKQGENLSSLSSLLGLIK